MGGIMEEKPFQHRYHMQRSGELLNEARSILMAESNRILPENESLAKKLKHTAIAIEAIIICNNFEEE
jgi:hypothetical protein